MLEGAKEFVLAPYTTSALEQEPFESWVGKRSPEELSRAFPQGLPPSQRVYKCTVGAGQTIVFPPLYWHQVHTM